MDADGSIVIDTEIDDQKAQAELNRLEKKIDSLNQKIAQGNAAKSPLVMQAKELGVQLDAAKAKLAEMQSASTGSFSSDAIQAQNETVKSLQYQWDTVNQKVERYDAAIRKAKAELDASRTRAGQLSMSLAGAGDGSQQAAATIRERFQQAVADLPSKFAQAGQSAVSALGGAIRKLPGLFKSVMSAAGKALKTLGSSVMRAAKNLNVFSKLSDALRGKLTRLGNTLKSALVFSVIYQGLAQLRQMVGSYLSVNNELQTALGRLKGAFLTAFQPIYEAVIPALVSLVNLLTRAMAAIASFTAAIFGTTTKQAQENASALYDQAQATSAAGGAAEEAQKQLAGFDEINKLSGGSKGGGGGGGGAAEKAAVPDFSMDLGDPKVFDSWGDAFDSFLNDILKNGIPKLESGFDRFKTWLNNFSKNMLQMFTFPGVLEKVQTLGTNLALAFNNLVSGIDWFLLGQALGAGLNTAIQFLVSFISTFDWISLGMSLATAFNGVMSQIDWYALGALLTSGFTIAISTLAGFLLGLDMKELAQSASRLVMGFFDSITETLTSIDWQQIGKQVKEFLVNVDWAGVAKSTFTAMGAAFGSLTAFLWGLIQDAWKEVVNWWYDVAYEDGKFTLTGLLQGILDVVASIGTWIWNNIFQPFINGFKAAFGISSPSSVMKEQGNYIMDGLLAGIIEKAGDVLPEFKDILNGVLNFIKGTFTGDWSLAWDGVSGIFKGVWNGIVGMLEGAVNIIIRGVNWLIQQLNKISFDVPSWVPGIGGKSFGINIPMISEIEIPRLAAGAVIPPNREFLAVLGDQKSGTNIEAPLSTIEQSVENVMRRLGLVGARNEAVLMLDNEVLGRVVYELNQRESNRIGVNLVEAF